MTPAVIAIGIVAIAAGFVGWLANYFKQPTIPAFILVGVAVGPIGLKLIHQPEAISTLSDLAIIFVMFVIGLEMDLRKIQTVGAVVTLGGLFQVVATGLVGMAVFLFFFWNLSSAVYIGLVFAFSSTTLVVKTLSDQKQLSTIKGRIVLGILLFQDLLAILALSLIASKGLSPEIIIGTVIKAIGIVAVGMLLGRYVFPRLFRKANGNIEVLTILSVAVAFAFAFLAENQGLSASIGAFITGVSLANLPSSLELTGRAKGLRDFFLPIFFVSIGLQLTAPAPHHWLPAIALIVACIVLKPFVTAIGISLFGYQKRISLFIGAALMPISEFGLMLVAVGISLKQISGDTMTISLMAMIGTMLVSSYLLNDKIFEKSVRMMGFLDKISRKNCQPDEALVADDTPVDIVLLGCHSVGYAIVENSGGKNIVVIELQPERYAQLEGYDVRRIFGDVIEPEIWDNVGKITEKTRVISTIPDAKTNKAVLAFLQERWPGAQFIPQASGFEEESELYANGATLVISPRLTASYLLTQGILDAEDLGDLQRQACEHLKTETDKWCPAGKCPVKT